MSDNPGPWFKMFAREWLEATRNMTLEVRAAYIDVLCLIYDHDGPIPDDDKWVAHQLHISTRLWRPIRAQLVAESKLFEVDGGLHNRRAQIEIGRRANRRRVNAENAANRHRNDLENGENRRVINGGAERFAGYSQLESKSDPDDYLSICPNTPRARGLNEAERNEILNWLILAMPATHVNKHGAWLRSLVDQHGVDVVLNAFSRCRGHIEVGNVKSAAVHSYIERAADELALKLLRARA